MDLDRGMRLLDDAAEDGGFTVELSSATRALITRHGDSVPYEIAARNAPPTPSVVSRDLDRLGRSGRPETHLLYVVPRLTESLRRTALTEGIISVVALDDALVIHDAHEWRADQERDARLSSSRGRRPWGRFALLRALLRTERPRSQSVLATETGVRQQSVALALPRLAQLGVIRVRGGWTASRPESLWEAFQNSYPGPGGVRRYWSAAAPLDVQFERAITTATAADPGVLVSGDAAADRQAPLRRPVTTTLFARSDVDLSSRFARADTAATSTIAVLVPADTTVFATARAWYGPDADITDPVITAWEVSRSRGADRDDAVAHLRDTVLGERHAR